MGKFKAQESALVAIVLLTILTVAPAGAANLLKDIGLQKAGDTVVVVISTTQPDEFNAFLLDSKPERIVIDLQGVTNSLTQKRFETLPCRSIQSIRTSQYKTSPNLVTRVVLDVNRPIDFKSFRKDNDILIKIPAVEGESEFEGWQAAGPSVAPAEQVAVTTAAPEAKSRAQTQPAAGVQIESSPKRKVVDYGTTGFRDPFVSLVGSISGQMKGEIPALENLKLVGILEDIDGSRALLEDGEGNGYMLMPNDRVRNGYLVSVSKNKAVFQVTEYGWTRTVALELKIPELE